MPSETRPMSVGEWMITILVLAIPLVNVVMYVYWAFSDTGNLNRKTFCQASLIWFLVLVAAAVVVGVFGGLFSMLR